MVGSLRAPHGRPEASGGPRESILDEEMISRLGLKQEDVLAIEGRLKLALTQARYQYAANHDYEMEEAISANRKKTDDTMAAIHAHSLCPNRTP
jgi:hypothetical protein